MSDISTIKLPIPAFLKVLTGNGVPTAKAMSITGKIYKTYNTPAALADLTDFKLKAAGVDDKDDRKLAMAAIRKAGYKPIKRSVKHRDDTEATPDESGPSSSTLCSDMSVPNATAHNTGAPTPRRKRKREQTRNEFLPDRPPDELEEQTYGSLKFNEVLDEETLRVKFVVVNRAPIMTAWSFIVAERLGFKREEALSIASVYTEMNAISKGVSIGIYDESKKNGVEATKGGSQPYVDLMGRRPLYQTAKSTWLALSSSKPVAPTSSYSYITRSLRQTAPFVIGALRLLADSYTPEELNKHGFALYAEFRPEVSGWGGRGEVRCAKLLELRKKNTSTALKGGGSGAGGSQEESSEKSTPAESLVKTDGEGHTDTEDGQPETKKPRLATSMSLEEYEAALDADDTFADLDLSFLDGPSTPVAKDT